MECKMAWKSNLRQDQCFIISILTSHNQDKYSFNHFKSPLNQSKCWLLNLISCSIIPNAFHTKTGKIVTGTF